MLPSFLKRTVTWKQLLKWLLFAVGGILSLVLLIILGLFAYINYQGPKSQEQTDSLQVIKNLKAPPQPETFTNTEELSTDEPEIYDDRTTKEKSIGEDHLKP